MPYIFYYSFLKKAVALLAILALCPNFFTLKYYYSYSFEEKDVRAVGLTSEETNISITCYNLFARKRIPDVLIIF
ncbi:hypothetical protein [Butyrivibrio sp. INlla14]|uniref:hypothetical protein n=1 Tax=Butyrivibrio sp. INlla14 TaxID=1520808 RepID=UPI000B82C2CA|nr:hypothetical protein [Butyrivibrio sp. INlla14]